MNVCAPCAMRAPRYAPKSQLSDLLSMSAPRGLVSGATMIRPNRSAALNAPALDVKFSHVHVRPLRKYTACKRNPQAQHHSSRCCASAHAHNRMADSSKRAHNKHTGAR